jgi:hypothetical protein
VWNLQSLRLKERNGGQPVGFDQIMTADFVLYIRSRMDRIDSSPWFPFTFVYISRHQPTMELFVRAQSAGYFAKIKPRLGAKDLDTLKAKVAQFDQDQHRPKANFHTLDVAHVMGIEKIATIP